MSVISVRRSLAWVAPAIAVLTKGMEGKIWSTKYYLEYLLLVPYCDSL